MAARSVIAERRAKVVAKLDAMKARLKDEFGIVVDEQPITNRDPDLGQVQQLENVAAVLEGAMGAIDGTAGTTETVVAPIVADEVAIPESEDGEGQGGAGDEDDATEPEGDGTEVVEIQLSDPKPPAKSAPKRGRKPNPAK